MGMWRYTTVGCQRVWRWYARAGRAQAAHALPACTRAAALALPLLPLLALPGAAVVPGAPGAVHAPPMLDAGGGLADVAPDRYGSEYSITPGGYGPADFGWGAFTGLSAGSPTQPASLTTVARSDIAAVAWANLPPQQIRKVRPALPSMDALPSAFAAPDIPEEQPQSVPCPSSAWVLLAGLSGLALVRRRRP